MPSALGRIGIPSKRCKIDKPTAGKSETKQVRMSCGVPIRPKADGMTVGLVCAKR